MIANARHLAPADRFASKVLLIGWDAADWKIIHPLVDAGEMPHLASLIERGVCGPIATLQPALSPMLWTSIATGKQPYKHGVLGFSEPTPDGAGVRPVTSLSRKTKAFWNILSQSGLRSQVVGWWPSHPVEPIAGAMVSNHFQQAHRPPTEPWPMWPHTVHPARLTDELADLRLHPGELRAEHLLPFVPRAAEVDQERDDRLAAIAKILAECTSIHAAATWLLENEPWDLAAVYYDAIDHFSHGFMQYHPPRRDFIRERDFDLYQGVVAAAYRYHDQMLGRLLSLVPPETTVILLSDHGFHSDHLRPRNIPFEPAGPAVEHRDFGVFVMAGPGIRKDEIVHGVSLLDVTPTILRLFGLPVGEDMDGRCLSEAFEIAPEPASIPSWDAFHGESGELPADARIDPVETFEALHQLVALGYIEAPQEDGRKAAEQAVQELRFNLARSLMGDNQHAPAADVLRVLVKDSPDALRFGLQLALCLRATGQLDELHTLVEELAAREEQSAVEAGLKYEQLLARLNEEYPQLRGLGAAQSSLDPSVWDEIPREERIRVHCLDSRRRVNRYAFEYLRGMAMLGAGDSPTALQHLANAEAAHTDRPGLHIQIGEAYLSLGRCTDARRAFLRGLELDPDNPHARLGICRSLLGCREFEAASQNALIAIGLVYHFPLAHFCLGVALERLERLPAACQALQVAVRLNPNFLQAQRLLAHLHHRLGDHDAAREHETIAQEIEWSRTLAADKENAAPVVPLVAQPAQTRAPAITRESPKSKESPVIVVSGLPRSGTSLMMQMLQAAGVPLLTDGVRTADEDNPRGYFELEAVKRTAHDTSWLNDAAGKAVKLIHLLLLELPTQGRHFQVILMRRNIDEVLESQSRMLARNDCDPSSPTDLRRVFNRQMELLRERLATDPFCDVLEVDFNELHADPRSGAMRIAEFLDCTDRVDAMAAVVSSELYRNRARKLLPSSV